MVLGLITTKKGKLESGEGLKERIGKASRYFPLERLGLSPQCGFASSVMGNTISFEEQRRKLEQVAQTAQEVWG